MTLIRTKLEGETLPHWWGIVERDYNRNAFIIAPFGLNLLFRWALALYRRVRAPARWSAYDIGWQDGYRCGAIPHCRD